MLTEHNLSYIEIYANNLLYAIDSPSQIIENTINNTQCIQPFSYVIDNIRYELEYGYIIDNIRYDLEKYNNIVHSVKFGSIWKVDSTYTQG